MADKILKPLAAVVIVLLIIGFSPLVDADSGWKSTLGEIVWWAIIVTGAALLALGAFAFATRRRTSRP
jgi:hypothetical protein